MANETPVPPAVLWAQRKQYVYLTFGIECKTPDIKIEKQSVYFRGVNEQDKKAHEVTIPLFDTIDPEKSCFNNKGRCIEMVLTKEKKDEPYWPALTSDKKKPHYLKIDFNKWRDEDEDNEGGVDPMDNVGLEDILRNMGGVGDSNLSNKTSLDDLESDSDDENLPDLE